MRKKKEISQFIGFFFIIMSFFAHRSMLVLILLTPFVLVKFRKIHFFILVVLFPFVLMTISNIMMFFSEDMIVGGEFLESFSESAQKYSNLDSQTLNWKMKLITNLKFWGFYIATAYIFWKVRISNKTVPLTPALEKILTMAILIVAVSVAFILVDSVGATDILAYRYLYMSGIPIVLIITYFLQVKMLSYKKSVLVMFLCTLSTIGFIVGKLFFAS